MPHPEGKVALIPIRLRSELSEVGNKAMNTQLMMGYGLRVPKSWAIPYWLGDLYFEDREKALDVLEKGLETLRASRGTYAVRSSAEGEDEVKRSFAGQFLSVMKVTGKDLPQAVERVWLSLKDPALDGYSTAPLRMGILIQEMVHPEVSGVSFSCDPLNGRRVAVVEAVEGEGSKLVQDGLTPWRFEVTPDLIKISGGDDLDRRLLNQVVQVTFRLRRRVGRDLDLEWVYDGKKLHWVQMRSLTGLSSLDRYTNSFSQEFLPGMIKPLVWSVNVPINSMAWVRLLGELTGRKDLSAQRLAKSFYYRAYFNMGEFAKVWEAMGLPDDLLEKMVLMRGGGMKMRPTPELMIASWRFVPFLWSKRRWFQEVDDAIKRLRKDYQDRCSEKLEQLSDTELMERTEGLLKTAEESAYYTVLCIMSSSMATRIWRKYLDRKGLDWQELSLCTEGEGGFPESRLFELRRLMDEADGEDIMTSDADSAKEFQRAFGEFMEEYGHYSESGNDFSVAPWREHPDLVLDIIKKMDDKERREAKKARGAIVGGLQRREAKFRSYRERMGSTYTRHYSMFRNYFLEAGERLQARGVLESREGIFMLELSELRSALLGGNSDWGGLTDRRSKEMAELADITLPSVIYGEVPPPVHQEPLKVLEGTPSSGGYYKGKARVVRGLADMRNLERGEVLVIPYSDVGWTPFFHLAGAVVSESGGMLSHSSIIAREYGIPAVVSVPGAMRLENGMTLEIDGYRGKVMVVDGSSAL
ncbi:MAG: PEP/pyruvate-binding domain-containing protein [Methanomassiliicoccales archaeon]